MTDGRIRDAQKNIQELLKEKPEYVLNTSEFVDVKARMSMLENRRKVTSEDSNRPRLRRSPGNRRVDDEHGSKKGNDKDERPTLKRLEN